MGTEQKEAQARSVGRQQLDIGLLEGEVSQDNGNLQDPLGLHVTNTRVPRRVEEALPALLIQCTICREEKRKNLALHEKASHSLLGVDKYTIGACRSVPLYCFLWPYHQLCLPCAGLLLSHISSLTSASSTTSFQNCRKKEAVSRACVHIPKNQLMPNQATLN